MPSQSHARVTTSPRSHFQSRSVVYQQVRYRTWALGIDIPLVKYGSRPRLLHVRPGVDLVANEHRDGHLHRLRNSDSEVFLSRGEQKEVCSGERGKFHFAI